MARLVLILFIADQAVYTMLSSINYIEFSRKMYIVQSFAHDEFEQFTTESCFFAPNCLADITL